jgi:hypothetical protein
MFDIDFIFDINDVLSILHFVVIKHNHILPMDELIHCNIKISNKNN